MRGPYWIQVWWECERVRWFDNKEYWSVVVGTSATPFTLLNEPHSTDYNKIWIWSCWFWFSVPIFGVLIVALWYWLLFRFLRHQKIWLHENDAHSLCFVENIWEEKIVYWWAPTNKKTYGGLSWFVNLDNSMFRW